MGNLCYSIGEADRRFLCLLTSIFSAGANGRNIFHKHSFNNWWRDILPEKIKTNMYSVRKVHLIGIFFLFLLNDYGLGNQFTEVVHC